MCIYRVSRSNPDNACEVIEWTEISNKVRLRPEPTDDVPPRSRRTSCVTRVHRTSRSERIQTVPPMYRSCTYRLRVIPYAPRPKRHVYTVTVSFRTYRLCTVPYVPSPYHFKRTASVALVHTATEPDPSMNHRPCGQLTPHI